MSELKKKSFFSLFALCVIPAIFILLSLRARAAAGPFWLGVNSDPSYIYLIASLHILDGIPPIFVVHPGTTLQVLGAVVFRLMHPALGVDALVREVLLHPEVHLQTLHLVLIAFFVLSLGALSFFLWRRTRDIVLVLLAQLPAVLYLTIASYRSPDPVIPVNANVIAETLLMTGMNLFNGVMLAFLFDDTKRERPGMAVLAGVVCGLCLATKFTFLPFVLAPFLLLRGTKGKGIFTLTTGGVWLAAVSPIIPRFPRMFRWITTLITHTGMHGSGQAGFIDLQAYQQNLLWEIGRYPQYPVLFFAALVAVILFWRIKEPKEEDPSDSALRFCVIIMVTFLIDFLVIAKQPEAHYITPLVGFSALLMIGTYRLGFRYPWMKKLGIGLVLAAVIVQTSRAALEQTRLRMLNNKILAFSRQIRDQYADWAVCGFYRSSSVPIALDFGNDCYGLKAYGRILNELYPDQYFYNYWLKRFHDFEKRVTLTDIQKKKEGVLLYGSHSDFSKGFLKVEKMVEGGREAAYKVLYSTVDRAVEHYLVAKNLESRKKFRAAYLHALTAQKLGFPDIDQYLQYLKTRVSIPEK